MDKTDRLRDYGLAFLLYEQGLGVCGYELIRELFIFVKLILNSYLYKYSYATNTISLIREFKTDEPFIIRSIQMWKPDTILCLSWQQGILQMNLKNFEITPFPFQYGNDNVGIIIDSQQRIWLSTYNNGVKCFSAQGKLIASYTTQNSRLSSDIVLCMTEFKQKIWMGSK